MDSEWGVRTIAGAHLGREPLLNSLSIGVVEQSFRFGSAPLTVGLSVDDSLRQRDIVQDRMFVVEQQIQLSLFARDVFQQLGQVLVSRQISIRVVWLLILIWRLTLDLMSSLLVVMVAERRVEVVEVSLGETLETSTLFGVEWLKKRAIVYMKISVPCPLKPDPLTPSSQTFHSFPSHTITMRTLLILLALLVPLVDTVVIPSPLKSSYQSIAGPPPPSIILGEAPTQLPKALGRNFPSQRALNLDVNVRLLTVLALQQSGWQLYEDHWYKLFEKDLMWIPAENVCRSMGGHLVSIKDESENLFVHKLRKKNNVWIGLNKLNDTFQVYKWSDGTEADFLNWDSSQPNEPEVDCAYMAFHQEQRGTWFDYGCREMLPQFFVCELPMP